MSRQPLVQNAADKAQVRKARKKEGYDRILELTDLRTILNQPQGRRVMWRILEQAKIFGSIWDGSARIHYNAGQQDFGHFIMSEIIAADPEFFYTMMRENGDKKEDVAVDDQKQDEPKED